MDKETVEQLIEKLEAATEGSRELDHFVALTVGWQFKWGNDRERGYWKWSDFSWTEQSYGVPPNFTTSLDAALTLVPSEHAWIVEDTVGRGGGPGREGIGACVWNCEEPPPIYRAETAILALCIAALKARLALPGLSCSDDRVKKRKRNG